MNYLLWTVVAYLLGSLPFAIWVGNLLAGSDIRQYGDRNPGATNVLRAGSTAGFLLVLILDVTKGALPVGLAYQQWGIQDWRIVPIALAPILGHAFSPFLGWRGGKALATTLGVWIGLTIWQMSLAALLALIAWRLVVVPSGWAVLLALLTLAFVLAIWLPDPVFFAVLGGQSLILLWKHGPELRQRPELRRRAKV